MAEPFLVSLDGKIGPLADAYIRIDDDGLLRGDGVFEVMRIYGGIPYALGDHIKRLEASASKISLELDTPAIESEVSALLAERPDLDAALRIVATRGGRRILTLEPIPEWNPTITLASVTYSPSVILTGVKSISYAANMEATRMAQAAGAEEALFVTPHQTVLEAPTSSIFWVDPEGQLVTPSLDCGILASITRDRVIGDLEVVEGRFSQADLAEASEAFLASTTREIQAIGSIDGRVLPAAPGPRTASAIDSFSATLKRELAAAQ